MYIIKLFFYIILGIMNKNAESGRKRAFVKIFFAENMKKPPEQLSDEYGQRITITISLQDQNKNDIIIKTGWMVHPLGRITCSTAFTGVVKWN